MNMRDLGPGEGHIPANAVNSDPLRQPLAEELARVRHLIQGSRRHAHHFMTMFASISGLGIDTCIARFEQMLDAAETRLLPAEPINPGTPRNETVPQTVHRIWLTNIDEPAEPPADYIAKLAHDISVFSSKGWTHNFWVQDPSLIPRAIESLQLANGKIEIRTIAESGISNQTQVLFDTFVRDRKFPFAADILRVVILYAEGGLYADLGARFVSEKYASVIRENFDYAFIFWETMFLQNSFMMMAPKNKVAKAFLEITEDPYCIPQQIVTPLSGIREGMAFSGLLITAILLSVYDERMRVCPLASNFRLVTWSAQQSWYTDIGDKVGKYGNAYVPESGPSFFKVDGWQDRGSERIHPIFRAKNR